ncbi:MAG TPA: hypothetical protein PLJ35_18925 [Anaerolineae bacterium]|nr:hypothetical protein [Anaerolineae bacterium]HOR00892.1 hypothetical protein [Anaerolineae bacterium]HPL29399.1 hypothetical protein [Anaerolineae bacterium]
MQSKDQAITHASELGEYAYCRAAWWLGRVQGLPSANRAALARGHTLHQEHGRRARWAAQLGSVAAWTLGLALVLVVVGLVLCTIGGEGL